MADPQSRDLSGQTFGRWTVLDTYEETGKGERKWLCRCSCGTERYVLERALKSGGSLDCGCLHRETVTEADANDLTGQRAHRGASAHKKRDITGQRFGRLTALYPTAERSSKGYVLWHCRCDCGNELDVSYNDLMYSTQKSCGCQRREHWQALGSFLTHIDGTSVEMLKSRKLPTSNSTGFRGVYFIRGKYVAKLVFQRKAYYLGTYRNIDDAVKARRQAEDAIFTQAAIFYDAWKVKAEHDPKWAENNPATVTVKRDRNDHLYLETWPCL